jgi:hypothetical protein
LDVLLTQPEKHSSLDKEKDKSRWSFSFLSIFLEKKEKKILIFGMNSNPYEIVSRVTKIFLQVDRD